MNIVVTNNQNLDKQQKERLEKLGDVTFYENLPKNTAEYLKRVENADIICSGRAGLQDTYRQLKNTYITVPFVSVAFLDTNILKQNNVKISNSPGANKYAVSEWIIGMMTILVKSLDSLINTKKQFARCGGLPPITPGLAGKNITILGHGNIGTRVGQIASCLEMNVTFFDKGDNLSEKVKNADVIVDALSSNPSTKNIINNIFFESLKAGAYFITISGHNVVDYDAMITAVNRGILAGAASDCGSILAGDVKDSLYKKLLKHPKIFVTPHISYNSDTTNRVGGDIMIDNVEAWINNKPKNILN